MMHKLYTPFKPTRIPFLLERESPSNKHRVRDRNDNKRGGQNGLYSWHARMHRFRRTRGINSTLQNNKGSVTSKLSEDTNGNVIKNYQRRQVMTNKPRPF